MYTIDRPLMRSDDNGPIAMHRLEIELDVRLVSVWLQAWDVEDWDTEIVAAFLRFAYGKGYEDALTEPRRGALHMAIGQAVPARRRPQADEPVSPPD